MILYLIANQPKTGIHFVNYVDKKKNPTTYGPETYRLCNICYTNIGIPATKIPIKSDLKINYADYTKKLPNEFGSIN